LALNVNCTLVWNRRYHFTEVEIGNQVKIKQREREREKEKRERERETEE